MALRIDYAHPLRAFDARVELTVERGETLALVGPSGAGKTTTLRVVAGLLRPRSGRITVDDETWLDTSARHRPLAGATTRRLPLPGVRTLPAPRRVRERPLRRAERRHRSTSCSSGSGSRRSRDARVRELSGGERQRVALARALARQPRALLLDEPLSALDAHTKASVRSELHELLRELGLPTILVTHDFEDAAALADRIGVIVDGRVVQEGSAADLVARPLDAFVASLTGASLLRGIARADGSGLTEVVLDDGGSAWSTHEASGRVGLAVYPWEVTLGRDVTEDSSMNHLSGVVTSIVPVGNRARVRVGDLVAEISAASLDRLGLREGDTVVTSFKATAARLVPLA